MQASSLETMAGTQLDCQLTLTPLHGTGRLNSFMPGASLTAFKLQELLPARMKDAFP